MKHRGQAIVELALVLPLLIVMLIGIVEMGHFLNAYLDAVDATREAARYGSDLDPEHYDYRYNLNSQWKDVNSVIDCNTTTDFYAVIYCDADIVFPRDFHPGNGYDDIVITVYTANDGVVTQQFPWDTQGWSRWGHHTSRIDVAEINELLARLGDAKCIVSGYLVVEIFYMHKQVFALPFITLFIPENIPMYAYSIMPNATAGSMEACR